MQELTLPQPARGWVRPGLHALGFVAWTSKVPCSLISALSGLASASVSARSGAGWAAILFAANECCGAAGHRLLWSGSVRVLVASATSSAHCLIGALPLHCKTPFHSPASPWPLLRRWSVAPTRSKSL